MLGKRSATRTTRSGALAAVAVLVVGCGPIRLASGGKATALAPASRRNTISFEVEESRLPSKVPQAGSGRLTYGKKIGGQSCASCHGTDGKPAVANAPDFSQTASIRDRNPLALEQFLVTGHGHAYGDTLTLQDRWDVIAYCRYLSVNIETVRDTKTSLFGKNCNVCHGNKGFGNGFLAPTMQPPPRNLTDYKKWGPLRTDQEIFNNIWYGVHWSSMPPWRGTLTEPEVWSIVDFIRALQYDPPESG